MTTADTLRARIAEAEACIVAVTENSFARQVLTARRAALTDALALLEQPAPVVTLDAPTPQPAGSPTVELISQAEIDRMYERGDPALDPDPEIPPAAASPAGRDRVAPSDPPADRGTLAEDEPSPVYTRARVALLRDLWPDTTLPLPEILARLNALPGIPIASAPAMQQQAKKLGLVGCRRHKRPSPAEAETLQAVAPTVAGARRVAPSDPPAGSGHPSRPASSRTPARDAVIRELWPDRSVTLADIARRYNALPGRQISGTSIYYVAKALGFGGRAAEVRKIVEVTPQKSDAAPDDPLAGLPFDDLAEARRMIASNQHGAKDLARHFGWDEPRAIRIAAAIRDDLTRPELAERLRAEAKAA